MLNDKAQVLMEAGWRYWFLPCRPLHRAKHNIQLASPGMRNVGKREEGREGGKRGRKGRKNTLKPTSIFQSWKTFISGNQDTEGVCFKRGRGGGGLFILTEHNKINLFFLNCHQQKAH